MSLTIYNTRYIIIYFCPIIPTWLQYVFGKNGNCVFDCTKCLRYSVKKEKKPEVFRHLLIRYLYNMLFSVLLKPIKYVLPLKCCIYEKTKEG